MNWTKEEDAIVKNNYESLSKKELMNLLPNRSWNAIQMRGRRIFNLDRSEFKKRYGNSYAKGIKHEYKQRSKKENCHYISNRGYKYIKVKEFQDTINGWEGYRPEHIYLMEQQLVRKLNRSKFGKGEGVHHIDGDKLNNSLDNLILYKDEKEHRDFHNQLQKISFTLVKIGLIKFNKKNKSYYL